ncbi:MAG: MoaE-MoaD fusion protein [Chloroflexota bacterium]|nr:MoaE-MoaD fusion protein [Chloroflexota bacterium]
MITVTVRLFAILRQQAGWRDRSLELAQGATIEDAWQALIVLAPELAKSREVVRFARNREYTGAGTRLEDGDELVLIPPVAGGSDDETMLRVEIREEPIDDDLVTELRATVPTAADGAVVVFVGQTRETPGTPAPGEEAAAAQHAGERVDRLQYEAFEEMALDVLRAIGAEIEERFGVHRLAIVHRTGAVDVGQASVVIVAAAAHRGAAFDAARYAIEELKARAPIWKAEHFASGSVWLGAPAREGPVRRS